MPRTAKKPYAINSYSIPKKLVHYEHIFVLIDVYLPELPYYQQEQLMKKY